MRIVNSDSKIRNMKTRFMPLLLGLLLPFGQLFANEVWTEKAPIAIPEKVNNLENLLEGRVLGNSFFINFNISQVEFNSLIEREVIDEITIDFFWKNNAGDTIVPVSSTVLENITILFDIENWSYEITPADTLNGYYMAQVALNEAACGPRVAIPIVQDVYEEEPPPSDFEFYECGDIVPEIVIDTEVLQKEDLGPLFFVGGFPIYLDSGVEGDNGVYSGTGIVPLPFKKQVVKVFFNNVKVDRKHQIYEGKVVAESDNPALYPNFKLSVDTFNIGGDICQEPPLDTLDIAQYGFDPVTGLLPDGSKYNEQGYYVGKDENGNNIILHEDTNTPYNTCGCDIDGKGGTYQGETHVCQPNCNTNEDAAKFAAAMEHTLGDSIALIIAELQAEMQDSLGNLNCGVLRTEMRGLVNTLGFDSLFIFGVGSKYLNKGMYQEFEKRPQSLTATVERSADAKILEDKHVDLFQCDKIEYQLETALIALEALANNTNLSEDILAKIEAWSQYSVDKYSKDPVKFKAWLRDQIEQLLNQESGIEGISAVSPMFQTPTNPFSPRERWGAIPSYQKNRTSNSKPFFQFDQGYSTHNMTASTEENTLFDHTFTLADASFEYLQGAAQINGVDRVYFMEELVRQQMFNPSKRSDYLQPVVVEKRDSANNRTIAIYLDSIVFTPSGATLDAYALIEDGESEKKLSFRGKRLHFGPSGLAGESNLSLGVDVQIRLNNSAMLVIEGTPQTNVAWDCDGFKSVSIDAYIEICRKKIIPLDPSTLDTIAGDDSNYKLDFDIQEITGWLEFYAEVDAPPFVVRDAPTIKWELSKMILDFSSTETPAFKPMTGYMSPFYDGRTMAPGWKGFYVKSLQATLPKSLFNPKDTSNTTNNTTIAANDILIDGNGFTGGVGFSGDILSIDDGSIGGWPFSITGVNVRVLNNKLAGGGMEGQVQVPIFEDPLDYEAVIYPGDQYSFTVSVDSSLTAPLFLATVELNGDSKVEIGKIDGEFVTKATLSGRLQVDGSKDANAPLQLGLTKMCFQDFEVSNQAPYFSPGKWGIVKDGSQATDFKPDAGGFGIKVDNLLPYNPGEGKIGLGLDVGVILNDKFSIAAEGRLGIEGRLEETDGRQKWVYDGIHISKLAVDASFPSTKIKGVVEWFDSEREPSREGINWGKGFRGALSAEFESFDVKVEAAAQFGKLPDYKYFYVDALVHPGKLASGTGFLQLRGFGGGVSYHMDINQKEVSFLDASEEGSDGLDLPKIGESFSGSFYTPADTIGLGLKATAIIAAGNESIFNGTVSLLVLFNDGAGINKIGIQGSGQLLADLDLGIKPIFKKGEAPDPTNVKAAISANVDLAYNFSEPSFHGDLEVYMLAANGQLRGAGEDYKLVDAALHFDPDKWYIHIGRPQQGSRAGIIAQLPGLGEGLHLDAYMQVGTQTDPMPPIPSKVVAIAYKINRNESLRKSGAGFVLGASIGFEMKAEIAKIVEARLEAEAGFDIMLRKYTGVSCADSGKPIGIDGWYAAGQMYAYAYGKLKVFGVNIAEAGIAAVLQARLPNPFFAQATVGVKVKVGPLKAQKSLKLTLGNDCTLVSDTDDALGMEVITYLNPSNEEANVETNVQPTATFALSLDRPYEVTSLDNRTHRYKVRLVETVLTDGAGGGLSHRIAYNEDRTAVRAIPNNTLPPNDSITFTVTVRVFEGDAFVQEETKQTTFATADALTYIPEANVKAAYPANGMVNFYRNEYSQQEGFIELVSGQAELFDNLLEGATQQVQLTSATGTVSTMNFRYDDGTNKLTFPLNGNQLEAGTLYKLAITQTTGGIDTNTSPPDEAPSTADNVAVGNTAETELYALYFRVSDYDTFGEKLEATLNTSATAIGGVILHDLPEILGELEINGTNKYNALIEFSTNLNHNWINQTVKNHFDSLDNLIHCGDNYPTLADLSSSVTTTKTRGRTLVTQNDFNVGTFNGNAQQRLSFELEKQVAEFSAIRKALILECGGGSEGTLMADCADSGGSDAECEAFLAKTNATYGPLPTGSQFTVFVNYRLPNGQTTTTKEISFTKSVPINN